MPEKTRWSSGKAVQNPVQAAMIAFHWAPCEGFIVANWRHFLKATRQQLNCGKGVGSGRKVLRMRRPPCPLRWIGIA
jgi:hypothetical protein